jgi:hypothetical protein
MIKVYLDGARFYGDQNSQIAKGFTEIGCEVTDFISEASLIYSNNPSPTRTQIVKDKKDGRLKPGAKLIFCVLDYPSHLEHTESFQKEIPQIKADLSAADAICSISEYTQRMVKEKYGFDSTVIYNPMKPITNLNTYPRKYFGCIVGRKTDPNKNVAAVIGALQLLKIPESSILMVGAESIGYGSYVGVVSDENLNQIYNSCLFSFSMGEIEGINLPAVESAAAGCIPVINSRLTTREELFPSRFFPEYNNVHADPESIANFVLKMSDNGRAGGFISLLSRHYQSSLKDKFSGRSVAEKILKVYHSL